ncbi:hypothetical protein RRG08_043246 [Elysia crispata]|uniref:Uncharacterized protein n=1 Tax=Elysia crispata TaxID=231223 RepID=A0AAE1CP62_9GAST|nr:hypothetical protein RRG08_043246 [Elysia crispata]
MDVNNDRKRKEELQLTLIMTQDMALYFRKLGTFETAEVAEVATFMRTVAIHYRKYHDDLLENLPSRLSGLKTILKKQSILSSDGGHTDHQKRVAYKQLGVQYMLRQVSGHALCERLLEGWNL